MFQNFPGFFWLGAFLRTEAKFAVGDGGHGDFAGRQLGEARQHFGGAVVLDVNADFGVDLVARNDYNSTRSCGKLSSRSTIKSAGNEASR